MNYKLPRIYIKGELSISKAINLKEEYNYLKNVLRLKENDKLRIFNENGEYIAIITEIRKNSLNINLTDKIENKTLSPKTKFTIFFALIKPARMEVIFEKCTEIGIDIFHPIVTDYSNNYNLNYDRFNKIIKEATEQSERMNLPIIEPVCKLFDILDNWEGGKILWADEKFEGTINAQNVCNIHNILIGPEGGFSNIERQKLQKYEFIIPISLGQNILRAETAAITATNFIKFSNIINY